MDTSNRNLIPPKLKSLQYNLESPSPAFLFVAIPTAHHHSPAQPSTPRATPVPAVATKTCTQGRTNTIHNYVLDPSLTIFPI